MAHSGGRGFGIIGLGTIAEFHAKAIQAMEGGHLVAAYSRSGGEKAETFAKNSGVKVHTGDINAFLETPGLDVVTIATPSGAHLEPALAAAAHKKHILCEKPLEITLERCDKMIAACKKNKVQLAGIFQNRSNPGIKAIHAALEAGRFGKLTIVGALVPWWRTQAYYDSGGWRGTWELDGGGALMNQSIHQLDLLQFFGGPIKELTAYAACLAHQRIDVEDAAVGAVRFKNGALGLLLGSTAMHPGDSAEVFVSGEKGSAKLRGGHLVSFQFEKDDPADAQIRIDCGPPANETGKGGAADPRAISFTGHQRQFENFVRGLEGKDKLLVDGREARKSVELILSIYQSALSRKAVKLPLKKTPKLGKFPK